MKTKITVTALACALIIGLGAYAISGSGDLDLTNDPLISLSYLNEVFWPKVENAIAKAVGDVDFSDSKNDETDNNTSSEEENSADQNDAASFEYEVLHLIQGDIVLAETPCEIILRSGSANAYLSGNESGIADLTAGVDLMEGDALSSNHLLLIPRGGDGRGFIVTSGEVYIMVRGGYTIVAE